MATNPVANNKNEHQAPHSPGNDQHIVHTEKWQRFSDWLHCICVVNFDLELGKWTIENPGGRELLIHLLNVLLIECVSSLIFLMRSRTSDGGKELFASLLRSSSQIQLKMCEHFANCIFVGHLSTTHQIRWTGKVKHLLSGISGFEFRLHGWYSISRTVTSGSGNAKYIVEATTHTVQQSMHSGATCRCGTLLGFRLFSSDQGHSPSTWIFSKGYTKPSILSLSQHTDVLMSNC